MHGTMGRYDTDAFAGASHHSASAHITPSPTANANTLTAKLVADLGLNLGAEFLNAEVVTGGEHARTARVTKALRRRRPPLRPTREADRTTGGHGVVTDNRSDNRGRINALAVPSLQDADPLPG